MKQKDQLILEQIYLGILDEAKKKKAKGEVNPWAIAKSIAKEKDYDSKKEEEIVKGIKKGAKKTGKKITSKGFVKENCKECGCMDEKSPNVENMTDDELANYLDIAVSDRANYTREELIELAHEHSKKHQ
jgi:hypothetical protein